MPDIALPHWDRPPERAARTVVAIFILAASAAFALAARWALGMHGFSDDLGLIHELAKHAGTAAGWESVWQRWVGPLWGPGSVMWRPWAYTSLALDAWLWGADGRLWHVTNLVLHAAASGGTALLAWRLTRRGLAAAVAFATMLLNPWSPEIVFWLVGRFDGWATCLMLLSLLALTLHRLDHALPLSLLAAVGAYLSKESALLLPALVALTLFSGARRMHAGEGAKAARFVLAAHILLAVVYLAVRALTVGTWSTAAYPVVITDDASLLARGQAFLSAVTAHAQAMVMPGHAPGHETDSKVGSIALVAVTALAFLLAMASGKSELRRMSVVAVLWIGAVLSAVALHFPGVAPGMDGARLYYPAAPAHALLLAAGLAGLVARWSQPRPVGAAVAALVLLLPGTMAFAKAAWLWQQASAEVEHAADAIAQIVRAHRSDRGYGLVMLADRVGPVPLFRNAQGGILALAARRNPDVEPAVDFVVPMTDRQVDEWHRLMRERVVAKLTSRSDAPETPTRFWCVDAIDRRALSLGHWPPDHDWAVRWRASVQRCVGLTP
jgi:hypothetical protein